MVYSHQNPCKAGFEILPFLPPTTQLTILTSSKKISIMAKERANIVKCTSRNVLLPGDLVPQPATITIDTSTGKIVDIHPGLQLNRESPDDVDVAWIDAGEKFVLPGLIEFVISPVGLGTASELTQTSKLAPMCISMSLAARTGKVSGPGRGRQLLVVSLPLWICLSIPSRRQLPSKISN